MIFIQFFDETLSDVLDECCFDAEDWPHVPRVGDEIEVQDDVYRVRVVRWVRLFSGTGVKVAVIVRPAE